MLKGKVVFITGSTRGIGLAAAELCAQHGATILLNGCSNADRLRAKAEEISREFDVRAEGFVCDVADPEAVQNVYRQIFKNYKQLDVLVNNAGILQDGFVGMIPHDDIERTLAVNLAGALYNLQAATRLMSRKKAGSIINMTSIIGVNGNVGQALYGSSKAGLIGLTRSAAKELAPKGIRVNAIAPGFIDTDMARSIPPETFEERVASIGMNRIGTPREVANVVLFLASDLSAYVTGQVIGVDGGMII